MYIEKRFIQIILLAIFFLLAGITNVYSQEVKNGINPPSDVKATFDNTKYKGKIAVTWERVKNAAKYKILRAEEEDGEFIELSSDLIYTSYIDNEVEANKEYYYKIGASNDEGEWSKPSVATKGRALELTKPKTTVITYISNGIYVDKIILEWKGIKEADKYAVYRMEGNKNYVLLNDNLKYNYYIDSDIEYGKEYSYKIKVHNESGWSGFSKPKKGKKRIPNTHTFFGRITGIALNLLSIVYPAPIGWGSFNMQGNLVGSTIMGIFYFPSLALTIGGGLWYATDFKMNPVLVSGLIGLGITAILGIFIPIFSSYPEKSRVVEFDPDKNVPVISVGFDPENDSVGLSLGFYF